MKKRFIFFILLGFSVILAGGCVHTSMKSEIQVFPIREGNGIPEEIRNNIVAQMPGYYVEIVTEVSGNVQVQFLFSDGKGNLIKDGSFSPVVMNGQTRSAVFLGVAQGLFNSGLNVFSSAAQEYYGRKNQGRSSFGPVIQNN